MSFLMGAVLVACGDDGGDGASVDPASLTHRDFREGFWVRENASFERTEPAVWQFTTVAEARRLYGGRGLEFGGVELLDKGLEAFGDDDDIVLAFQPDAHRLSQVIAVRVRDGKLGESNYGMLGFSFGFAPATERTITRFQRRTSFELDVNALNPEVTVFRWIPDCRWRSPTGWQSFTAPIFGVPTAPWLSATVTRKGDFVAAFRGDEFGRKSAVWLEGRCPIMTQRELPFATGSWLAAHSDDGVLGLRRSANGLEGVAIDPVDATSPTGHDEAVKSAIREVVEVDGGYVVLEAIRLLSGQTAGHTRSRVDRAGQATAMPLPAAPEGASLNDFVLLPDGRAGLRYTEVDARGQPTRRVVAVESNGGWKELSLVGTTDDGQVVDFGRADTNFLDFAIDNRERIVAILPADGILDATHRYREVPAELEVLVRLDDGELDLRVLPHSAHAFHVAVRVDASGTASVFGQQEAGLLPADLAVITWPVGGDISVSNPGMPVVVNAGSDFYEGAVYAGTDIDHEPQFQVGPGGSFMVTDGWWRVFVRPPDALFRPKRHDVTLTLVDPPPGATIRSVYAPTASCEDACTLEVDEGGVLGLVFDLPEGWLVNHERQAGQEGEPGGPGFCSPAVMDASFCHIVVTGEETFEYTFMQTPILEVSTDTVAGYMADVVTGPDGRMGALLAISGTSLPDGTPVSGATPQSPVLALSRWSGTDFDWARLLPEGFTLVTFGLADDGDLVALFAVAGQTATFEGVGGGAPIVVGRSGRLVVRFAAVGGAVQGAVGLELPSFFFPTEQLVMGDGGVAFYGSASSGAADPEAELQVPRGHDVVLRFDAAGDPSVWFTTPNTLATRPAKIVEHVGGLFVLVGSSAGSAELRRVVISSGGEVTRDDTMAVVTSKVMPFDRVRLSRVGDGLALGFHAEGVVSVDGASAAGTESSVVVARFGATGAVESVVRLPTTHGLRDVAPTAITTLDDGRFAVSSRADQFGEEVFLVQDEGELLVGTNYARGGNVEGYETRALQGLADGRLLWIGRTWSPQVMRPYRLQGAFVAVLDADRLPGASAVLERSERP